MVITEAKGKTEEESCLAKVLLENELFSEAACKAKMVLDHPNMSVANVCELKSTKVTTDEDTKVADGLCAWPCSSDDAETNERAAK